MFPPSSWVVIPYSISCNFVVITNKMMSPGEMGSSCGSSGQNRASRRDSGPRNIRRVNADFVDSGCSTSMWWQTLRRISSVRHHDKTPGGTSRQRFHSWKFHSFGDFSKKRQKFYKRTDVLDKSPIEVWVKINYIYWSSDILWILKIQTWTHCSTRDRL